MCVWSIAYVRIIYTLRCYIAIVMSVSYFIYYLNMTELLIIFQLHTDKKTTIVSDMIIPVPKWLSNTELMKLIKDTLATIEWAGAILNIINLNIINAPKAEVVKDYTPRQERTSFWPKKEKSYGNNNGFSRGEGRPSARYASNSYGPHREDSRPSREDRPKREDSRPFREENKWWFRPNKPSGWYWHKPTWGSFHKWGRPSRPSKSR